MEYSSQDGMMVIGLGDKIIIIHARKSTSLLQ